MTNKTTTLLIIFFASLVTISPAQTKSAQSLTLDEAITEGLKNSNTLQAARYGSAAADAQARATMTTQLPTVSAGGSYTRLSEVPGFEIAVPTGDKITINDPILDTYNFKVGVEQPLFTGGKLLANVKAQKALARASHKDLETEQRELTYAIHQAYWQLYKARDFKRVSDDNVQTIESHLRDVNNLLEQGIVTKTEVLAVEVQLSNAKLLQIDASDNVRIAQISLCSLIGWPLNSEIDIATAPAGQARATNADAEELTATALNKRSELSALQQRIEAGHAGIRAAQGGWLPQIKAFGNIYYARPNQRIFPTRDQFDDTWDVGIGASWTVWNWGGTAQQVKQARAQVQQTEQLLEALKDRVAVEVTNDLLKQNEALEKIDVAATGAQFAEESLRSTREKFKAGLAPNSELLDAEDNVLRARWNHTQALVDYELAVAKLQKSTGETR